MRRKRWDVYIDPELLDRIHRHIGASPISNVVKRALEHWLIQLEEDEAAEIKGSSAPPAVLATPPRAVDPVPAEAARAVAKALLSDDFTRATRLAEELGGAPAPRSSRRAAPAREDAEARRAIRETIDRLGRS